MWATPSRMKMTVLTASGINENPQQKWNQRSTELIEIYDADLNCYLSQEKYSGYLHRVDSSCEGKFTTFLVPRDDQCTQQDVESYVNEDVKYFWAKKAAFYTEYEGIVEDPFYQTGVKYHKMRQSEWNRFIWFRVSDNAIVYEQDRSNDQ